MNSLHVWLGGMWADIAGRGGRMTGLYRWRHLQLTKDADADRQMDVKYTLTLEMHGHALFTETIRRFKINFTSDKKNPEKNYHQWVPV